MPGACENFRKGALWAHRGPGLEEAIWRTAILTAQLYGHCGAGEVALIHQQMLLKMGWLWRLQRPASKTRHGSHFLKELHCRPPHWARWGASGLLSAARLRSSILGIDFRCRVAASTSEPRPAYRPPLMISDLKVCTLLANCQAPSAFRCSAATVRMAILCCATPQLSHNGAISASRHRQRQSLQMLCLLEISKYSPAWDDVCGIHWNRCFSRYCPPLELQSGPEMMFAV